MVRDRLDRAFSRARYAAVGAAAGAFVGGLLSKNLASSGAALGALAGAVVGERRPAASNRIGELRERSEANLREFRSEESDG